MIVNNDISNQYLIFEVDEEFAIEISRVIEILELQPITTVPETPAYIPGVINLRGNVLPVIDVRVRFKKAKKEHSRRNCIIIVELDGIRLGLVVDGVVDLLTIPDDKILPPPQVGGNYTHVFIKAIGVYNDKMKLIIDGDKLVNYKDLEFFPDSEKEVSNNERI